MSAYATEMHVRDNVRMLCSRVQTLLLHRRPKQQPQRPEEEEEERVRSSLAAFHRLKTFENM